MELHIDWIYVILGGMVMILVAIYLSLILEDIKKNKPDWLTMASWMFYIQVEWSLEYPKVSNGADSLEKS